MPELLALGVGWSNELKNIESYFIEHSNENIKSFWSIFKGMNYQDKKAFFNFVAGGIRFGQEWSYKVASKLTIKIDEAMEKD